MDFENMNPTLTLLCRQTLSSLHEPSLRTETAFILVPEAYNFDVAKLSFWSELQNLLVKYVSKMCPVILILSEARDDKV